MNTLLGHRMFNVLLSPARGVIISIYLLWYTFAKGLLHWHIQYLTLYAEARHLGVRGSEQRKLENVNSPGQTFLVCFVLEAAIKAQR